MKSKPVSRTVDPTDVRFSRRLVVFHILALVALMSVTATIVFWISTQHNQLARSAAHKMVSAGVNSILGRVSSTVLDYSIWTEAYESILKSDLDWMYNNMGSGAAEIGAVDLIVLINPQSGAEHGWQAGTPMPGETGLIPPELLAKVLALLEKPTDEDGSAPTMFARMNGEIWAFAVTRVVPTEGSLGTEALQQAPIQIHGLRFSETLLTGSIGDRFLIDNVHLEPPGNAGAGSIALRGAEGTTIADLTWTPPSPGQRILEQIAIPLMAAMAIAGIFGALLSSFAVRNARRLEIALVDARAADRAKTDFIANVSHELRTPMNGIIGLGEVLKHTELDQNQSSLLDVMMTSAQSQMGLIRELLEISQIDAKNRTLQARRFDLSGLVGEVVDLARAQSTEKGIDLRFNVAAAETYNVIGDDGAVRQIMTNLVGNALKFTDEGFVSVEMSLEPVDDIGICRIAVTDTGPGIQAEDIERIFERFFQVDGSETRERGGTGLGLSISKSLAEMLGGEIAVESTPGKGSTFTLTAPFVVARVGDEALARAA